MDTYPVRMQVFTEVRFDVMIQILSSINRVFLSHAAVMLLKHQLTVLSCSHVSSASQDAAFNKTTRSLQELQQKDLGVKPEFRSVQHIKSIMFMCVRP